MQYATTKHWLPVVALLLPASVVFSGTAAWQSHDSIREAAEAAVRQVIPGPAELTADSPDPRLRLVECDRPLTSVAPGNGVRSARLTAEVRCEGSQPWRLYLPVRVASTRPVVVTTRALARDTVLAPGDVRLAKLAPGAAQVGTLADPANAIGRRLRRPVDEGQAITTGLIAAPTLVRRGQQVSVEAQAGSLKVQMAGTALKDGALGDIIDVQSASSGRTVEAVVRSAKSVEVLLRRRQVAAQEAVVARVGRQPARPSARIGQRDAGAVTEIDPAACKSHVGSGCDAERGPRIEIDHDRIRRIVGVALRQAQQPPAGKFDVDHAREHAVHASTLGRCRPAHQQQGVGRQGGQRNARRRTGGT